MTNGISNENGAEDPVIDKHTVIDEIADNIIKILLVCFMIYGISYCMVNYVGKDKGVDPNLVWGFFSGVIVTVISLYFRMPSKKEKPNEGQSK